MSINVKLLQYTGEPEKIVSAAAKLCYSSAGIDEVMEGLDEQKTARFLAMLMDMGHESPIEHVSFTFGVEGVSRSLLAQLTRHRIASYSVKSQRYVREGQFEYVVPPEIEKLPEARDAYIAAMQAAQEAYDKLAALLFDRHFAALTAAGAPEKKARTDAEKRAIEDARFVLPNACETKLIVTMNARSLMNFFHHRCCNRAQWEIRELAEKMLVLVRGVAPTLFRHAGPSCMGGRCPEGKMSCGKMDEMRTKYANL